MTYFIEIYFRTFNDKIDKGHYLEGTAIIKVDVPNSLNEQEKLNTIKDKVIMWAKENSENDYYIKPINYNVYKEDFLYSRQLNY